MTLTTTLLTKWYNQFNHTFFNDELPNTNINICVSKTKRALGSCQVPLFGVKTIKVSQYYKRTEIEYQATLIHEMIHLYEYIKFRTMSHGKFFKNMAKQKYTQSNGIYNIQRTSNTQYEVNEVCNKPITQPIVLFQDSNYNDSVIYPTKPLLKAVLDFIQNKPYLKLIGYGYITSHKYLYGSVCKSRFRYYHVSNIDEIIHHLKANNTYRKKI